MSWLSSLTGIHISPKGVSVEPSKLITDAAALAIPGVGGALTKGLGAIPGVGGALASGAGAVGSLGSKALGAIGLGGAAAGAARGDAANAAGAAGTSTSGSGGILGWLEKNPALASAGASLIGNTVGGIGQGQIANANRQEQQREFNATYGLGANQQALATNRISQTSPLRDQAQYLLQQRLGLTPHHFQPRDMFSPQGNAPQAGGVNMQQYAQNAAQYQPGMGGQTSGLPDDILKRLGYTSGTAAPSTSTTGWKA